MKQCNCQITLQKSVSFIPLVLSNIAIIKANLLNSSDKCKEINLLFNGLKKAMTQSASLS